MKTEDWIDVKIKLPEAGWTHSERVLVYYPGTEYNVETYGIAYYH